jgi:hypothetical protein
VTSSTDRVARDMRPRRLRRNRQSERNSGREPCARRTKTRCERHVLRRPLTSRFICHCSLEPGSITDYHRVDGPGRPVSRFVTGARGVPNFASWYIHKRRVRLRRKSPEEVKLTCFAALLPPGNIVGRAPDRRARAAEPPKILSYENECKPPTRGRFACGACEIPWVPEEGATRAPDDARVLSE